MSIRCERMDRNILLELPGVICDCLEDMREDVAPTGDDVTDCPLQSPLGDGCYRTRPAPNSDGG